MRFVDGIDNAMRGSRRRFRSFRWSGKVAMTISSPSRPTHAAVTCGAAVRIQRDHVRDRVTLDECAGGSRKRYARNGQTLVRRSDAAGRPVVRVHPGCRGIPVVEVGRYTSSLFGTVPPKAVSDPDTRFRRPRIARRDSPLDMTRGTGGPCFVAASSADDSRLGLMESPRDTEPTSRASPSARRRERCPMRLQVSSSSHGLSPEFEYGCDMHDRALPWSSGHDDTWAVPATHSWARPRTSAMPRSC